MSLFCYEIRYSDEIKGKGEEKVIPLFHFRNYEN